MRKKKYLRSATSFALAVTLLLGQVVTTGAADIFTDQPGAWDSEVSFGDGEDSVGEVTTKSETDHLFTDGSESSEEQKTEAVFASEEDAGAAQEAAAKPETAASILASEEETNRWHINADWTITNAQEQPVTLALVMDEQTRQALPQEWQAGEDGICHFALTDGTELPMTVCTEENDPGKIYLIAEQNGDGEYHLDFMLEGTEVKADLHSILDMVVYDEDTQTWSQSAHAELDWRTVQEEEPDPTETPEEPVQEEPAVTPEIPGEIPADPTEVPEESAEVPADPTGTPEAPAEVPAEATETPEAPAEPTEIPEEAEPAEDSLESEPEEISGEDETDTETVTEEIESNIEEDRSEQNSKYESGASAEAEGEAEGTSHSGMRKARSVMQDSIDMSDYITDAKFTPSEIEEGELVQLSISYSIQSSEMIQAGTNKLTYQLPEGIAPFETASGTVYNKNREAVGTYEITDTGSITITFNDTFVQSGNSITGDIHFWTLLSAEGDGEEHEYTFSESNQIIAKIKVKKDESESGGDTEEKTDIYVKKQETSFDKEAQTAAYEITVGTNHGTKGDISFNDDFAEAEDASGHKVTGTIENGTIVKIDKDGNSTKFVFDDYFNTANGDITLKNGTKLPELSAEERYVITYKMQFTGIDQMNGDVNLANAVTVHDDRSYSNDRVDIGFNHTYIKKTSTYDAKTDKINWQIMLNDFGADLTGYELTDTLEKNSITVLLPDTVTLTEYLDDGSTVDQEISIPYIFSSENVKSTKHKFVVSYSTDVSEDGFYTEYRNTAGIGDYTSGSGQNIKHDQGVLSKTYVQPSKDEEIKLEKVDDNTRNYLWKIVITAPSDGIKKNSYYLDKISAEPYAALSYHYITDEQLLNIGVKYADQYDVLHDLDSESYQIQVKSGENWVDFKDQSGTFTEFRLLFQQDLSYDKIVLSYRTTADLTEMQDGNTWEFKNSGEFYQDGGSTSDYDSTKEAKGGYLKKIDVGPNNGTYVYDECKGILYYRIIVNETHVLKADDGTIKIVDQLPPGTVLYTKPYKLSDMNPVYGSQDQTGDLNDRIVKIYFGGENNNTQGFYSDTGMGGVDFNINDKIPSFVYNEQKNEITVIIPEEVYLMQNYGHSEASSHMISIFYAVQIIDALEKGESKEYTNSAKMYLDDTEKAGDTVTDTVSSSYITKRQENSAQDGTNEASYQILINPTGAQLAGGSDLTLADVVDYNKHQVTYTLKGESHTKPYIQSVGLKANSLHLYRLNSDGSKGSEISTALYTVHYGEEPAEDPTKFKMEIVVPDETPCVLEYTYKFSVNEQVLKSAGKDSYDVTNDINLSGSVTDESGDKSEIKLQDSGATADTDSLLLTKVDKDNQVVYLKGAVFQLQRYTGEKDTSDWSADQYWANVKIYVTGENGTASLSGLEENTAYRLKEIEAPTNYTKSDSMQYFYIGSDESGFPEEFITEANKNNTSTGSIIISNKKSNTDYTAVSVDKKWLDARGKALDEVVDKDGNIIDSITVNLYQKTEADAEIAEDENPYKTAALSHDDANDWYFTFNDLPKADDEGNRYYYYVREASEVILETDGSSKTIDLTESFEMTNDQTSGIRSGTVTLINKRWPVTAVKLQKIWQDEQGNTLSGESITDIDGNVIKAIHVKLYRTLTENDTAGGTLLTSEGENGSIILCADNNWTYTVENLPIQDKESNYYYYAVEEAIATVTDAAGKEQEITLAENYILQNAKDGNTITIDLSDREDVTQVQMVNKRKNQVTVKKVWNSSSRLESIPVTLYRSVSGELQEESKASYSLEVQLLGNSGMTLYKSDIFEVPAGNVQIKIKDNYNYNGFDNSKISCAYSMGESKDKKTSDISYEKVQMPDQWGNSVDVGILNVYFDGNIGHGDTVNGNVVLMINIPTWSINASNISIETIDLDSGLTIPTKVSRLPADKEEVETISLGTAASVSSGHYSDDNWTFTWDNLDYADENGNPYHYYVLEGTTGTLSGYDASYSYTYKDEECTLADEITITNTAADSTTFAVQKIWAEGFEPSSTDGTYSIEGKLYKDGSSTALTDFTLPLENGDWVQRWENLESGSYRVEETAVKYTDSTGVITDVTSQFTVTYSDNNGTAGNSGTITMTNTPVPETTNITVNKIWQTVSETPKTEGLPDTIELKLYRKETDSEGAELWSEYTENMEATETAASPVTLCADSGWTYTWSGLPEGTYYVEEIRVGSQEIGVSGYTPMYSAASEEDSDKTVSSATASDVSVTEGTIVITNTEEPTSISVEKVWEDNENASGGRPEDIILKLYRTTEAPQVKSETESETPSAKTGSLIISNELSGNDTDANKEFRFTITLNDTAINETYSGVTFTNGIAVITLKGGESKTIEGLPEGTGYTVAEDDYIADGYETTKAGDTGTISEATVSQAVFTNTVKSADSGNSVTVKVVWENEIEPAEADAYVTIPLKSGVAWQIVQTKNVSAANNWETRFENLEGDEGTQYYVELQNIGKSASISIISVVGSGYSNWVNTDGTITITAQYDSTVANEISTQTAALTQVSDSLFVRTMSADEDTGDQSDILNGLQKPDSAVEVTNSQVTLSADASGNWIYTWDNLDKTDSQGNKYYYYVEEVVPDNYKASYSYQYTDNDQKQGIEKVTITNTYVPPPEPETIEITVNKVWKQQNGAEYTGTDLSGFEVSVKLTGTKEGVTPIEKTGVLNQNNGWSTKWSELDKTYTYSVTEVSVLDTSNNNAIVQRFTPSYSTNSLTETGTITITNTEEKQGILLPGTGSKYPFVFYGLGLAFLIVSTAWMFLTFKKRNTPIDAGKGGRRSKNEKTK